MLPCWLTGCSKKLLAAWKAARKRGKLKKKMNVGGEPKETAVSREIMPADGSSPAQRGVRHLARLRPSAAYLSPTGVANSKGGCHLSNASFDARRSARLPTAARPCAAISRERRTTTLAFAAFKRGYPRAIQESAPGPWIASGAARLDIGSLIGTHVRNGSFADIRRAKGEVRSTPESGHQRHTPSCLLWANMRHSPTYSITLSALTKMEFGIDKPSNFAVRALRISSWVV